MQNDLIEFYNMVSFCNPDILGSVSDFRKVYVCVCSICWIYAVQLFVLCLIST